MTTEFTVKEQKAIDYAFTLVQKKSNVNAILTSASQAQNFVYFKLAKEEREHFMVVFLSSQNQIISSEIMFSGTINQSPVFPREIAKKALLNNAAAVILAHNHPSGISEPSAADKSITDIIVDTLAILDVRVLDHIIVGSNKIYSFAEHGLI